MTAQAFAEIGFNRTVVEQEPAIDLHYPNEAAIRRHLADQRALFAAIRSVEFHTILAGLPPREYDPIRLCEENDVAFGYRLFLVREPESRKVVEAAQGQQTVFQFISGLAASVEYRRVEQAGGTLRPCSRDDVTYAYRLCLHRDPESERLFEEHVGITDAGVLTRAMWGGAERHRLWASVVPRN
jgi:hypothetical protein